MPLAFAGVTFGILISQNPRSRCIMCGVVALDGIAVNSAIVRIDAANHRLECGMRSLHAILDAARRRVVPVLVTAGTTIPGLFSLAAGLGGHSLLWGLEASASSWGLAFSTLLTLIIVPVLLAVFMRRKVGRTASAWTRRVRRPRSSAGKLIGARPNTIENKKPRLIAVSPRTPTVRHARSRLRTQAASPAGRG